MEDNSPQSYQKEKVATVDPSEISDRHAPVDHSLTPSQISTSSAEDCRSCDFDRSLPDIDRCVDSQSSRSDASTSWTYRLVSAGLAFCVWGGWGYFVNSQQAVSAASPAMSGLLHGLFSSMVTIVMLTSVTWLYRRFAAAGSRMLIPAVTTSAATGSCITTAHLLIGTANVPATVIPGLVVAFCFNLLTTKKLSQADHTSSSFKMSLT